MGGCYSESLREVLLGQGFLKGFINS
jgi:hypothetical protein